jgi:peptidoglycan/xylan/chitin deacetylase (PgdA/CDA1 family)
MHTDVSGSLRRRWRRMRRSGLPIILMYHRIGEGGEDPWGLAVGPRHFAEHLEVLRRRRRIMSLRELANGQPSGCPPGDIAVITFDDGYADNLHCAKPQLDRHGIPATVFVMTGALGDPAEFWWDHLGRLLLQPGRLPEVLRIALAGELREWRLDGAEEYGAAEAIAHHSWRAWEKPPTARHALYLALWRRLRPLPPHAREQLLVRLRAWAEVTAEVRPDRRSLTASELVALGDGGLIEIGAHTVTHASLPSQPRSLRETEIRESKSRLEHQLGHAVTSFAYPFGDCDDASAAAVLSAGFECACGTGEDAVRPGTDRFRLPRFQIHDWDGDEFERRLAACFTI